MARILIVEDDPAQSLLIEMMLARANVKYQTANNALSALDILSGDPDFDVVLTDIRLPGMDGLHFVQVLGRLYPQLPVLAMTVHGGSRWASQAVANGAAACLVKPFATDELINAIEAALRQQGQPQA